MQFATASSFSRNPTRPSLRMSPLSIRSPAAVAIIALVVVWTIFLIRGPSITSYRTAVGRMKGAISSIHSVAKDHNPRGWILKPSPDRPLILYAYSETPSARANLRYFIDHGLHAAADFIFILNGVTDVGNLLPENKNIKSIKRQNDCYDLGAYGEVLLKEDLYKKYKHFIMLNASLRGPFLPYWSEQCWSDLFLSKVTNEVKLVGITVNCWPQPHIQSMIWATDIIGIETLLFPTITDDYPERLGISQCFHDWNTAVEGEIDASQIILDAGYKLDVMMTVFHSDDEYIANCDSSQNGDFLWNGKYHGTNIHPYETIFMKTNRDVDPVLIERLTEWHNKANYSSWGRCMTQK